MLEEVLYSRALALLEHLYQDQTCLESGLVSKIEDFFKKTLRRVFKVSYRHE